ncbi:hypothetical protein [Celeribacter sp.]|uniref:hypothetical protein n=1 Tax=Celeribacter sp. TaxID=1890673 RepID=UPI003A8EB694
MMHDGNVEPKRNEVGGIVALRLELEKRRAGGEPYLEVLRGFLPPQMLADRDSLDCAIVEMALIDPEFTKEVMRFIRTFAPEFERMALEAI